MKLTHTFLLTAGLFITSAQTFAASEAHHFPGVFVGYTDAQDETEFTYGIEYEYKFNSTWGAGAVYEKVDDAHHGAGVDIVLAAIYLHPWKQLRVGLGFGKETVGSYEEDDGHGHTHHHASHKEDLVRASLSYDFHVGDFGVAPTVAVDFIGSDKAYVFGVALVRPF